MNDVKVIKIKEGILGDNNKEAEKLRNELIQKEVLLINVMSSPGSGKTTTLCSTINAMPNVNCAVMEADIDSDVDAITIMTNTNAYAIQLHTGGMCHLDAEMTRQGLDHLDLEKTDVVFLENVGNLVCPAEYDTGAIKNITILSVPEGMDKPLKYPLMYEVCDLVLINKIDVMPVFDFDLKKCEENIHRKNPNAKVIPVCAKTGEGIKEFASWIEKELFLIRREKDNG